MTRVERHLKMMNDIAKGKPPKVAKKFKIAVLTDYIENPLKEMTAEEIDLFRKALEEVKREA